MAAGDKPLPESPSQTAGPYLHIGCLPNFSGIEGVYPEDPGCCMVNENTRGERIRVQGCVYDGGGAPLLDAMIEIWQADAAGLYPSAHENHADVEFEGWGRQPCDPESGEFAFDTIKPGQVPYPDGRPQAPHITVWIVARGINIGLHTRLYFDDEADANADDPILAQLAAGQRSHTLIAKSDGEHRYRFDIYLQGENETVFFDM
ncbi:MAG: protocatechuate 3,4-dioxygenase subunit alpha [Gammaproteobacteria bacterium]|nr:protocatechuate 3,4-dioxygenase subunit alpha [Gammaproteobacteria bacterium]